MYKKTYCNKSTNPRKKIMLDILGDPEKAKNLLEEQNHNHNHHH